MKTYPELWKESLEMRLKDRVDSILRRPAFEFLAHEVKNHFLKFIQSGGKRLRPTIFHLAHSGYSRLPLNEETAVAVGLELFHLFALTHDDLIDGSPVRRDTFSLHELLRSRPGAAGVRDGRSLALVFGDFLFAAGIQTIVTMAIPHSIKHQVLEELLQIALNTAGGALTEIGLRDSESADAAMIRQLHKNKTAEYSFVGPLSLGALLGGAKPAERQRLRNMGLLLGRAYQIRDDLEDLQNLLNGKDNSEEAKRDVFQTLPLVLGLESTTRKDLKRPWIRFFQNPGPETSAEVFQLLHASQAFSKAQMEINQLLLEADRQFEEIDMAPEAIQNLKNYLGNLFETHGALNNAAVA